MTSEDAVVVRRCWWSLATLGRPTDGPVMGTDLEEEIVYLLIRLWNQLIERTK